MKHLVLVLFLALLPAQARSDEWTTTHTIVESGCIALFLIDRRQTLDRRYEESNPILGSRPSQAAVDVYFLG